MVYLDYNLWEHTDIIGGTNMSNNGWVAIMCYHDIDIKMGDSASLENSHCLGPC